MKELAEDRKLLISRDIYTALCDRLNTKGIRVLTTTITKRAITLECYKHHRKVQPHDQEGLTTVIGVCPSGED